MDGAAVPYNQLLQQQQQQLQQQQRSQSKPFMNFVPIDAPIAAPIPFFHFAGLPEQPPASYVHVAGIAPADGGAEVWEPGRKKAAREREFLENSSPVTSSIDFLHAGASAVSTGLGLSLDDGRVAAAVASSSVVNSPPLSLLLRPSIDDEIAREIERQDAEMDQFIKIQSEQLRQQILEKVQAKQIQTLTSAQDKFIRKIREKEAEVDDINRKNAELEEHMKQLTLEVAAWQHRAKYNENMIAALKLNLQQVYAMAQENNNNNNKEGCGDSEVDDSASYCGGTGGGGASNMRLVSNENKDMRDLMTCKVCRAHEACMLLLPCRHLCLCKECEATLSFCPLCRCSKLFGTEIYM